MEKNKQKAKKYCAVLNCLNTDCDPNLTFFMLPEDTERRRKWLILINREDLLEKEDFKNESHLVCCAHFEDSSIQIIKHLKENALPTLLLQNQTQGDSSCSHCSQVQSTFTQIQGFQSDNNDQHYFQVSLCDDRTEPDKKTDETHVKTEPDEEPVVNHVRTEPHEEINLTHVKTEPHEEINLTHVKTEPDEETVESDEENVLEHCLTLYPDHEIKEELVIGPEVLQDVPRTEHDDEGVVTESAHEDHAWTSAPTCDHSFVCDHCQQSFTTKRSLANHIAIHSSVKTFTCEFCHKIFTKKKYLSKHLKLHSRGKKGSCQKSHLKIHSLETGEKRFSCEVCPKKFTYKSSLTAHYLIHTGVKRFSCEMCPKKFTYKSNLKTHYLVHTRKFTCEICRKTFAKEYELTIHLIQHLGY